MYTAALFTTATKLETNRIFINDEFFKIVYFIQQKTIISKKTPTTAVPTS